MPTLDDLPTPKAISSGFAQLLSQTPKVEGPEKLVNFKLNQVARRSGGMFVAALHRNLQGDEEIIGWMGVGIRMAIATGCMMVMDPSVEEKVENVESNDLTLDAAREVLNVATVFFNQELENKGWEYGIRVGHARPMAPNEMKGEGVDADNFSVGGIYLIHFPDIRALDKRGGSLFVAFE
ncbi:hypothetical protein [Thiohalorhabdus methylotrophus]|uniref:Uncharacterized protein n=1 Tax=Thiohalorhabdus methylotrophus TaxID=3242694 RepID=A0ABV4TZE8_9GAMM